MKYIRLNYDMLTVFIHIYTSWKFKVQQLEHMKTRNYLQSWDYLLIYLLKETVKRKVY